MNVLFLFESVLPQTYHQETTSPGELRVIAAQPQVTTVWAIGPEGTSFYDVHKQKQTKTTVEQKLSLIHFRWGQTPLAYYTTWMGLLWQGMKLCRTHQIDVIHAESPYISGIAALILGKLFKAKVVVEYRVSYDQLLVTRYGRLAGSALQRLFWHVAGWVLRRADYVAANSLTYETYLKKRLQITSVGHYNPGVRVPANFKKMKHTGVEVGWLGRLYPDKGPMYFLQLIALGQDWFRQHAVRFTLGGNGPEMKRLKQYALAQGISDLLTMCGNSDRWQFFRTVDVLVNTTMVGAALEMNIAEAASVGIPAVAFGKDKLPETIHHSHTGYIVPRGAVDQLTRTVQQVIENDILRQRLGRQAIVQAQAYTLAQQILQLKGIYQTLLA